MSSDLATKLKNVKLKKVNEPKRDASGPKLDGYVTTEEIQSYEDSVLAVNTEQWIDMFRDLTFPTVLAPFYLEDAQLFMDVYSRLYLNKDSSVVLKTDWQDKLTDKEKSKFETIKDRLRDAMSVFTESGYAFVKLSSRSAKDAPLLQKRFKDIYFEKLNSCIESEKSDENIKLTCLLQAAFDALRVKTADDVLDMFIRSERVYQDLLLIAVNQKERFEENFVIRKFVDIEVDMEFRGFVFDGVLTALSQYNYLIYSKRLVEKHDEVQKLIQNFYTSIVKTRLEQTNQTFPKNFIIDFAVCSKEKNESFDTVWIIEINPFLNTTDGAMFSWEKERDILKGRKGFLFRLVQKPKPGSTAMLPTGIRELFKSI